MIFPIWTPAYLVELSLGNCPIQSILCLQVAAEQRRLEAERLRLEASRNLRIQLPSFRWRHDMRSLYFIHVISHDIWVNYNDLTATSLEIMALFEVSEILSFTQMISHDMYISVPSIFHEYPIKSAYSHIYSHEYSTEIASICPKHHIPCHLISSPYMPDMPIFTHSHSHSHSYSWNIP